MSVHKYLHLLCPFVRTSRRHTDEDRWYEGGSVPGWLWLHQRGQQGKSEVTWCIAGVKQRGDQSNERATRELREGYERGSEQRGRIWATREGRLKAVLPRRVESILICLGLPWFAVICGVWAAARQRSCRWWHVWQQSLRPVLMKDSYQHEF